MKTARLNAFTDGVIAIIITIMVLEFPLPHGTGFEAIKPIVPLLAAYALAFANVGLFWNNHHHLMHLVNEVDGRVLWANHALLFWLSLVPFVIRWIGEGGVTAGPIAAYGIVLLMAALSYGILERSIVAVDADSSDLERAIGKGRKELISLILYGSGIALAFVWVWAAIACFVIVAAIWIVPDRRVEVTLEEKDRDDGGQRAP